MELCELVFANIRITTEVPSLLPVLKNTLLQVVGKTENKSKIMLETNREVRGPRQYDALSQDHILLIVVQCVEKFQYETKLNTKGY